MEDQVLSLFSDLKPGEEVLQLLEKKFPGRGFKQGYGMTESTGCITTHPLNKHPFKYARTGGTLVANTVVKVMNNEGKLVGVDEQGEVGPFQNLAPYQHSSKPKPLSIQQHEQQQDNL